MVSRTALLGFVGLCFVGSGGASTGSPILNSLNDMRVNEAATKEALTRGYNESFRLMMDSMNKYFAATKPFKKLMERVKELVGLLSELHAAQERLKKESPTEVTRRQEESNKVLIARYTEEYDRLRIAISSSHDAEKTKKYGEEIVRYIDMHLAVSNELDRLRPWYHADS